MTPKPRMTTPVDLPLTLAPAPDGAGRFWHALSGALSPTDSTRPGATVGVVIDTDSDGVRTNVTLLRVSGDTPVSWRLPNGLSHLRWEDWKSLDQNVRGPIAPFLMDLMFDIPVPGRIGMHRSAITLDGGYDSSQIFTASGVLSLCDSELGVEHALSMLDPESEDAPSAQDASIDNAAMLFTPAPQSAHARLDHAPGLEILRRIAEHHLTGMLMETWHPPRLILTDPAGA